MSTFAPVDARIAPTQQLKLGIYSGDGLQAKTQIEQIEARLGSQFSIVHVYTGFNESFARFREAKLEPIHRDGSTTMISWAPGVSKGVLYNEIANGHQDAYLKDWARGIKAWNKPVFIRFAYEMNMSNMAWNATEENGGPQAFIEAWRHMHQIFEEANVTNVRWIWCPHADENSPYYTGLLKYYPGDAFVDWIGLDGYHWGGGWYGQEGNSFDRIFKNAYQQVSAKGKPMMIAEMASDADSQSQSRWLATAFRKIAAEYPRIKAVIYFNADFSRRGEKDWRISQRQDTLQALRSLTHPPVIAGRPDDI